MIQKAANKTGTYIISNLFLANGDCVWEMNEKIASTELSVWHAQSHIVCTLNLNDITQKAENSYKEN